MSLVADYSPLSQPSRLDDPRREVMAGASLAALFFVGVLGWGAVARLDAVSFASGKVSVGGGPQVIQSSEGGVVQGLFVKEGDRVRSGQVLLEISSADLRSQVASLTSQVITAKALVARLQAEQAGDATVRPWKGFELLAAPARAEAEIAIANEQKNLSVSYRQDSVMRGVLAQRVVQTQEQIRGAQSQMESLQTRSSLLDNQVEVMRGLADKGYVSKMKISELEENQAQLGGQSGNTRAEIARLSSMAGEARLQIANQASQRRRDVADQLRLAIDNLRVLEPRLAVAQTQLSRAELKAPVDGRVFNLNATTIGGVVGAGEKLMQVVPSERGLIIEARIPTQDGADVHVGQEAHIRLPALHERNLPPLTGKLISVSADSLVDEKSGQSFFTAQVQADPASVAALDKARGVSQVLKPGLAADVSISLRKRTALEYALEPLFQTFNRSMHER